MLHSDVLPDTGSNRGALINLLSFQITKNGTTPGTLYGVRSVQIDLLTRHWKRRRMEQPSVFSKVVRITSVLRSEFWLVRRCDDSSDNSPAIYKSQVYININTLVLMCIFGGKSQLFDMCSMEGVSSLSSLFVTVEKMSWCKISETHWGKALRGK